jgi:hypothetical protein
LIWQAHTPPLREPLLARAHSKDCITNDPTACWLCWLEWFAATAAATAAGSAHAILPALCVENAQQLSLGFVAGAQADAHEFLLEIIDQLQVWYGMVWYSKSCIVVKIREPKSCIPTGHSLTCSLSPTFSFTHIPSLSHSLTHSTHLQDSAKVRSKADRTGEGEHSYMFQLLRGETTSRTRCEHCREFCTSTEQNTGLELEVAWRKAGGGAGRVSAASLEEALAHYTGVEDLEGVVAWTVRNTPPAGAAAGGGAAR